MITKLIYFARLTLLGVISIFSCTAALATTAAPDILKHTGELRFCTELGQPPAAYIADDGATPEGFEVDIMNAIGDELGLKTAITNYKFAGILAALDANKCDAVMSSTSVSPERLQKYQFVEYMKASSGLLVRKGNPLNINTFDDLSGRRVAVLLGSANERRLREASAKLVSAGKGPMNIATYTSNVIAFSELKLGRADAFVSSALTLGYFMGQTGGSDFEIGGMPVPPSTLGIMLPNSQLDKAEAIRTAYQAIFNSGKITQIVNKWNAQNAVEMCNANCDGAAASAATTAKSREPSPVSSGIKFDVPFFISFVFSPPPALLYGIVLTILAATVSMLFGVLLGALLAIGGLSRHRAVRTAIKLYVNFFRGTPVLVQLVLIYFGVPALLGGLDLFPPEMSILGISMSGAVIAGIVTFSLHEAAYESEIFRAGIESIDIGQSEASKSLGMSPRLTMRRVILPQAIKVILPPIGNQFNMMLKTTSLLSVIAVPELFHVADAVQSVTYKSFEVYLGVSVYYLALTGFWSLVQRWLECRLNVGRRSSIPTEEFKPEVAQSRN